MIKVNAMGDPCPIPVVKTKNAIKELKGNGQVETLVDNEIAVQNLTKMANQKGYGVFSEKIEEGKYRVVMTVGDISAEENTKTVCAPDSRGNKLVVISSYCMGKGDDELGAALMKAFIFALTQQDELPSAMIFYNGGARLTCESSPALEDIRSLEACGVEIMTCGTCLNHYNLSDKLKVGSVSNMYAIAEKMLEADLIIKP